MTKLRFLTAAAPLVLACGLAAQDGRPLALVNARILTMTDAGTIENGTIVVVDGRIESVGADVDVPPGARVIDAAGGTVMPGFVHAWSRAGLEDERAQGPRTRSRGRGRPRSRGGSSGANAVVQAATKVADELYARQDVYGELLREGVTTLVVRPEATGFPGLSARLAPDAATAEEMTLSDAVYLVADAAPSPKAGKTMKEALDKAKKALEERKKPKAEEKKPDAPKPEKDAEAKPAGGEEKKEGETPPKKEGETPPKDGEKEGAEAEKPPEKKPEAKQPERKKDPNLEILADLLDGKRTAFLRLSSAMEIQHWRGAIGDHEFPTVVVADRPNERQGFLTSELEWLKKATKIVLTTPRLQELPNTRTLVNTPAALHAAGISVGFVLPDDARGLHDLRFQLMEVVRCGLPADAALRAVTAVPAEALGLKDEVGSLAKGRRADLLVFTGDPLDPTSRLRAVILEGREVEATADR